MGVTIDELTSPCEGCDAPCCYSWIVPLTEEERLSGKYVSHEWRVPLTNTVRHGVKKKHETHACVYFNERGKRCEVYADRPAVCKTFQCFRCFDALAHPLPFLTENPDVFIRLWNFFSEHNLCIDDIVPNRLR